MKVKRWIIEILFGVALFPFAVLLGLLTGTLDFYSSFHKAINKKLMEGKQQ